MPKKAQRYVAVQAVVSIPRAGEFKVGIMVPADLFPEKPTTEDLTGVVALEVRDRLRVRLEKGELARFIRTTSKRA